MIYVIYVQGGLELTIEQELNRLGFTAFAPRRIMRYRLKGVFHSIAEVIFNGYVFIDLPNGINPNDYYKIVRVRGVGKFLSSTSGLSADEAEYIKALCDNGDVEIAHGKIENNRLKFDDECFLKKYENNIVRFSKRQHKVTIEFTLYGKPHRTIYSCDID